jgi:hypothetical protein
MVALVLTVGITLDNRSKPMFDRVTETTPKRSSHSRIKRQFKDCCSSLFGNNGCVVVTAIIDHYT